MSLDTSTANYDYPIVADPWIKVNDYAWQTHCCQITYQWQPRSHQEWRYQYLGSLDGNWAHAHLPWYWWPWPDANWNPLYMTWANSRGRRNTGLLVSEP